MQKKLLTWLDIERYIREKTNNCTKFPEKVLWIDFFSDAIEIGVESSSRQSAIMMLKEWFNDWFQEETCHISLDIGEGTVAVEILENEDGSQFKKGPKPLWQDVAYLKAPASGADITVFDGLALEPFDSPPSITAFHSFKGGVGRTTTLICYLFGLLNKVDTTTPLRVLLIDSDLEAPGVTYWLGEKDNKPSVSFIDYLEAVHYSPDKANVASFFGSEIKKTSINYLNSEIFVLPAFTHEGQLLDTRIMPEHIARGIGGNWSYGDEIHLLGRALGVTHIFVDLRAGLSEISSPLLFDPRIERFLVTTVAEQSVRGTALILEQIKKMMTCIPKITEDKFNTVKPSIIISMLTNELKESKTYERALTVLNSVYDPIEDNSGDLGELQINEAFFDASILSISNWDEAKFKLNKSTMINIADDWVEDKLTTHDFADKIEYEALSIRKLNEICDKYEFAEKGEGEDLLITEPIRNMAKKFRDSLPILISIGAKGSGKTFCYLQIARFQKWTSFLGKVFEETDASYLNAHIFPLLESKNLSDSAKEILFETRKKTSDVLGIQSGFRHSSFVDSIELELKNVDWTTKEWVDFWISKLAESVGLNSSSNSLSDLNDYLSDKSARIVFLLDGFEDVFLDIETNVVQQNALRALLELPNRISEIRNPYVGVILFVRRDYVKYTIKQNRSQFEALYKPYDLTWDSQSFLQLVYWVCSQAEVKNFHADKINLLRQNELLVSLEALWGRKLGRDNSKEAHTAKWVFAALTDFNGRLQARDIVRILLYASQITLENSNEIKLDLWKNSRILPPGAIRRSLDFCSKKKIDEAKEESPAFNRWVEHMELNYQASERTIPFSPDKYSMDSLTVEMLKDMGVLFEYQDSTDGMSKFYMPEIFRTGLKFNLEKGARPKVLALKRKAMGKDLF